MKNYLKFLPVAASLLFSACSPIWSDLGKDLTDIANDDVISVQVDKGAMQKDTDVEVSVKITNKDAPPYKNGQG